MTANTRRRLVGVLLAVMIASGCSGGESVEIMNTGESAVTLTLSGDDAETIEANGGAVFHTDKCYEAPIMVTFQGGRVVVLSESLCPGQRVLINDQDAKIDAGVSG